MAKKTVLVLTNQDLEGLLPMGECLAACEEAFWEFGHGIAQIVPPRRVNTPIREDGTWNWLNVIHGSVPRFNMAAVRVDSAKMRFRRTNGGARMDFPGTFSGFVLLFDLKTSELLCIYHDHYVSSLRVGATSAIGVKYMAREDSHTLGIVGTGFQAEGTVEAICRVRPIRLVKAYSTNKENCRRFAEKMSKRVGIEARAADDAKAVVQGSDIVVACTTSMEPVFDGAWLEEGTHVISTSGATRFDQRREIDEETVRRSGLVVVNLKEQIEIDQQPELMIPIRKGYLRLEDIHELGDLVTGKIPRWTTASRITHHSNNGGMGIQFAAAGAVIYENARRAGRGTELPAELFVTFRGEDDYSSP